MTISNLGAIPLQTATGTKDTDGSGTPVIASPGTGLRAVLVGFLIQLVSESVAENTVTVKSGTTAKMTVFLKEKPQGIVTMIPDKYKWAMGTNEAIYLDAVAADPFTYTIWYYIEEVTSSMT